MFKVILVLATVFVGCIHANKIVGGEPVEIEKRPFQISLQYLGSHSCGGSLVNPTTIVTAAHCTQRAATTYKVRLGSTFKNSSGELIDVDKVINHPRYSLASNYDSDVSILKLAKAVSYSDSIKPIKLHPRDADVPDGADTVVSGWGTLNSGGLSPVDLRQVTVPKVNQDECKRNYVLSSPITDTMICAGAAGIDSCQGDSGGPLTYGDELVGIVSWGRGCALAGYPGVYARVAALRDFIDENLN